MDTVPDTLHQLQSTIEQLNDKYQQQQPSIDDQYQTVDLQGYSEPTDHVSNAPDHVTSTEDHVTSTHNHVTPDHVTEPKDHVSSSEGHVSLGADFPMSIDDDLEPTLDETLIASDSATSLTGPPDSSTDLPKSPIPPSEPTTAQSKPSFIPLTTPHPEMTSSMTSSKPEEPSSGIAIDGGRLHEQAGHEIPTRQ